MKPQLERRSLRHRGGPPKKLVSAALPAPATTARCRVNSIWTFRGGAGGAWWESALTSVKWVEGPPICIFSSTWFLTAVSTFSRLILSLAETPVVIRSMSMVPVAPEISLVSPRDGKHGAGECSRLNLWRGRWPTAALLLPVIWMPPPHPVLPPAKKIFIYLWKTSGEAVWEDITIRRRWWRGHSLITNYEGNFFEALPVRRSGSEPRLHWGVSSFQSA